MNELSFKEKLSGAKSGTTKKCPFCAEEIQSEAIKCKHCGSLLDQASGNQLKPNSKKDRHVAVSNPKVGKDKMIYGIIFLVIGFPVLLGGIGDESVGTTVFGSILTGTGLILVLVGKFQHWYHWK